RRRSRHPPLPGRPPRPLRQVRRRRRPGGRPPRRRPLEDRPARRGDPCRGNARHLPGRRRRPQLGRRLGRRPGVVRPLLPRRAGAGGALAPVGVRGLVPDGGPSGRDPRPGTRRPGGGAGGERPMKLLAALRGERLDRPPIWFMRQAGRYLPEYRELRERCSFVEAMRRPDVAVEITLQPLRRFPLDAAIVFADIMTPLEALGIEVDFDPGPRLQPLSLDQVAHLPAFRPEAVGHVAATVAGVRAEVGADVAVIGFAGGPATVLAYLLEGSGSRHFSEFRRALHTPGVDAALGRL